MRAPLSVLAPQQDQCTHALLPFSTAHSLTHRFASLRAPCSQTMAHDLERIHVLRRDRRHLRRRLRRHLCRRATPALDPLDPVLDPAQRTEGGVDAVRPRRRSIGSASTAATSAPPAPSAPPSSSPSLSRSKPCAFRSVVLDSACSARERGGGPEHARRARGDAARPCIVERASHYMYLFIYLSERRPPARRLFRSRRVRYTRPY